MSLGNIFIEDKLVQRNSLLHTFQTYYPRRAKWYSLLSSSLAKLPRVQPNVKCLQAYSSSPQTDDTDGEDRMAENALGGEGNVASNAGSRKRKVRVHV